MVSAFSVSLTEIVPKSLPFKAVLGLEAQYHLMSVKVYPAAPTSSLSVLAQAELGTVLAEHHILGLGFVGFLAKSVFK